MEAQTVHGNATSDQSATHLKRFFFFFFSDDGLFLHTDVLRHVFLVGLLFRTTHFASGLICTTCLPFKYFRKYTGPTASVVEHLHFATPKADADG